MKTVMLFFFLLFNIACTQQTQGPDPEEAAAIETAQNLLEEQALKAPSWDPDQEMMYEGIQKTTVDEMQAEGYSSMEWGNEPHNETISTMSKGWMDECGNIIPRSEQGWHEHHPWDLGYFSGPPDTKNCSK